VKQSTINLTFKPISAQEKQRFKQLFARAVYRDNLPFTIFSNKGIRDAIHAVNPAIELPSRNLLSGNFLSAEYNEISRKVQQCVDQEKYLNIAADETTNFTNSRVLSFCCNIYGSGSFFIHSERLLGESVDAQFTAKWVEERIQHLINPAGTTLGWSEQQGHFKRINSIAFDTCNTQRAAQRVLKAIPHLQHVFYVLCESHGLQLLMKDVIEKHAWIKRIVDACQQLAVAFTTSPKQLGRLRAIMMELYTHQKSFVLSVITRWGTQLSLLRSVSNLEAAISKYFSLYSTSDGSERLFNVWTDQILTNITFWKDLNDVIGLLEPIDEAIKASEADRCVLSYVLPRWQQLRDQLLAKSSALSSRDPDLAKLDERVIAPRWNQ